MNEVPRYLEGHWWVPLSWATPRAIFPAPSSHNIGKGWRVRIVEPAWLAWLTEMKEVAH